MCRRSRALGSKPHGLPAGPYRGAERSTHTKVRHIRTGMCRDTYPYSGQIFVFRGRRGDKIKILWDSQDGLCLFYKRLRGGGRFVWPRAESGAVCLSAAQLSMLLEAIDWRAPKRTAPAPQDPDRVQPTRVV